MDSIREKVARAIGDTLYGSVNPVETPNTFGMSLAAADAAIAALLAELDDVRTLLPLLRLLTVRQVIASGDEAIDAAGLNPYCLREGLADGTEQAVRDWKIDAAIRALTP